MAVSAKPKVVKPKKVVKPAKKVAKKVAKPVKKVVKKPRRNNIRGGVGSQTRLSPNQERANLLPLPPSIRVSVSASRSLRPLPLPVSSLSSVSSSASGSAKKYIRREKLQPLPEPPLKKEEASAIADTEAKAVKAAILASEYWVNREKEIIAEVKLKMEKEAAARAEARAAVEKELQKERRRAREDKKAREERERENAATDDARRITKYNNSILQGDRRTDTNSVISRGHYSWLTGEKGDWEPYRTY